MARLTWDQLDSFQTADEVAGCLRRVGVKGLQASCEYCPLAVATGWIVTHRRRWWPWNDTKEAPLTAAQRAFTLSFDQGGYPDLIIGVKVKWLY